MSKSSSEYFLVREERLNEIREFSRLLSVAIVHYAQGDTAKIATINNNVSTRCPRCDMRLTGAEFLSVGQPDEQGEKKPKIERMQLGYCARSGCDASTCLVNFHRTPDVDWSGLFGGMHLSQDERKKSETAELALVKEKRRAELKRQAGRLAIGLGVIAILLIIWQWRRGGRIPVLREPEKFRVTIVPDGHK